MASPSTPKSNPTSPKSSPRSKLNATPKHDWVPDPEFYYELHTFQVDSVRFRIPTHHLAESPFFQKLFHVAAPSGPVETFCDVDHLEGVSRPMLCWSSVASWRGAGVWLRRVSFVHTGSISRDALSGVTRTRRFAVHCSLVSSSDHHTLSYATGSPRLPHSDSSRAAHKQLTKLSTQVTRRPGRAGHSVRAELGPVTQGMYVLSLQLLSRLCRRRISRPLGAALCSSEPRMRLPGESLPVYPVLPARQQARTLPPATLCQRVHRTPPSA
ncbi:hypothetical protein GSI_04782 [Ganoderma sinense ZZ0214-1]|uniref:Uncharacterized protein n=1 Tax=Ganoderma sinense ZZ0214-1 TaxID=1077348 RepID=A0A2G8SHV4_9APHY|nr:hypothetical protein GSI_04782 [Ganoderma sinense ZZ0214-1]